MELSDQNTYLSLDNRDLKSTAGTPVFFPDTSLAGLTVQRTAVLYTSELKLKFETPPGPLSRGISIRNGRLQPLNDELGLIIESPVISILQVSV